MPPIKCKDEKLNFLQNFFTRLADTKIGSESANMAEFIDDELFKAQRAMTQKEIDTAVGSADDRATAQAAEDCPKPTEVR